MFSSGAPEVSDDTLHNSQGRYPGGSLEAAYQITGKYYVCGCNLHAELQASACSVLYSNSTLCFPHSHDNYYSCWQTIILCMSTCRSCLQCSPSFWIFPCYICTISLPCTHPGTTRWWISSTCSLSTHWEPRGRPMACGNTLRTS